MAMAAKKAFLAAASHQEMKLVVGGVDVVQSHPVHSLDVQSHFVHSLVFQSRFVHSLDLRDGLNCGMTRALHGPVTLWW